MKVLIQTQNDIISRASEQICVFFSFFVKSKLSIVLKVF